MRGNRGFTMVELVIVVAIIGILAMAVLPLARWSVKRQQEYELQRSLRILRTAIDRYHDLAVSGAIEAGSGETGYPRSLEELVRGVVPVAEVPSPVPGVSDGYSASGFGLSGGYAKPPDEQPAGAPAAAAGGGEAAESEGTGGVETQGAPPGAAGVGRLGDDAAAPGSAPGNAAERRRSSLRSGGRGSRSGGGRGGAEVDHIVFLRRLPIDPFTGDTDWGLRCYGDPINDRSWCGRDVFDVYSKARGRGMDGRPYREW